MFLNLQQSLKKCELCELQNNCLTMEEHGLETEEKPPDIRDGSPCSVLPSASFFPRTA